ncbi:MAG: hypothetical protein GY869_14905, partial [Planctomycetes bacterium]|nr:hypothetical protein [Planctomycetota bacterium]
MMRKPTILFLMVVFVLVWSEVSWSQSFSTAFTYQGRLGDGGTPANEKYDFEFELYDDPNVADGIQVGSTITKEDVMLYEGYFTVTLDFGSMAFNGDGRWLQIGVRPGGSVSNFTLLSPRQELTPMPYALFAKTAEKLTGGIGVTGSGTVNYIPKFLDAMILGDSAIFESTSGNIGIGTTSPDKELTVQGDVQIKAVGSDVNLHLNSTSMNESRIYFDEGADHRWAFERKGTTNALVLNEYHPSLG